jgi:Anti-sigma factor NepR
MNKRLPSRRRHREDEERPGVAGRLGPEVKAKIGQHLRVMYAEIVDQGVPNRFVDILRRLDDQPDNEGSQNGTS